MFRYSRQRRWGFTVRCLPCGTRPAEVPKGGRARSGRKLADPIEADNRKVVLFGGGSGRPPGRGSGTVAGGGPGRGRGEVHEEVRDASAKTSGKTSASQRSKMFRREKKNLEPTQVDDPHHHDDAHRLQHHQDHQHHHDHHDQSDDDGDARDRDDRTTTDDGDGIDHSPTMTTRKMFTTTIHRSLNR